MSRSVIDIRDTIPNKFVPVDSDKAPPVLFSSDVLVSAYLRETSGAMVPLLFIPSEVAAARKRAHKNKEDVKQLQSKWQRILDIIWE